MPKTQRRKTTKAAIGYIRVSTARQANEGVSLDAQRARIGAYAQMQGLELVEVFADEGLTAKRGAKRPGLDAALEAVCRHRGVLVVYSLSRLARSTIDACKIAERINACNAGLASISESLDTTSSMGRFVFRLLASIAELEREQTGERVREAAHQKRRQHQRVTQFIPFGFDVQPDGQTLTPNKVEQQAIRRMKRQRRQGWTLQRIADDLTARGVMPKRGAKWHRKTVRDILSRADVNK